ncbi:VanZ family protein [Geoalkalibacter sp.]|uniref:VanZ family protein n=1 Tax=Geoalkalibacter sp. TaxID=3041440 RepID=UPI00272E212D|nr:VanZ family protein [Geoalkalibacter sp.]
MNLLKYSLLIGYCAALVWLSLASSLPQTGLDWPHKDKLGHALAYALMTLLAAWVWSRGASLTLKGLVLGLLFAMVFGGVMEFLQGLVTPARQAEWWDLFANFSGGLIVFFGGLRWLVRREKLNSRA